MKIKIKDLTLGKIIEIAEKYKEKCSECPLYFVKYLNCYTYCGCVKWKKECIKDHFDGEVEIDE